MCNRYSLTCERYYVVSGNTNKRRPLLFTTQLWTIRYTMKWWREERLRRLFLSQVVYLSQPASIKLYGWNFFFRKSIWRHVSGITWRWFSFSTITMADFFARTEEIGRWAIHGHEKNVGKANRKYINYWFMDDPWNQRVNVFIERYFLHCCPCFTCCVNSTFISFVSCDVFIFFILSFSHWESK